MPPSTNFPSIPGTIWVIRIWSWVSIIWGHQPLYLTHDRLLPLPSNSWWNEDESQEVRHMLFPTLCYTQIADVTFNYVHPIIPLNRLDNRYYLQSCDLGYAAASQTPRVQSTNSRRSL